MSRTLNPWRNWIFNKPGANMKSIITTEIYSHTNIEALQSAVKQLKSERIAFIFTFDQLREIRKLLPNYNLNYHKSACGLTITVNEENKNGRA